MSIIEFWEKPGCAGNARQRALLEKAGHRLNVHNLLAGSLAREELAAFFGQRPVREWFNRSAPAIKNGLVDPEKQTPESALELMLKQPILIRRPLMKIGGVRLVGFDLSALEEIVGRLPNSPIRLDGCVHADDQATGCSGGHSW
jgi:nitrogenase-associated protein